MKRIIRLLLAVILITACSTMEEAVLQITEPNTRTLSVETKFEYPTDFSHTENHQEAIKLCQLPDNMLGTISTSELAQYCYRYPMVKDMYFFNSPIDGLNSVVSRFNGFQELFHREDNFKCLFSLLKESYSKEINYYVMSLESIGDIALRNGFMELLLSDDRILGNCSVEETADLFEFSKDIFNMKQSNRTIFGGTNLSFSGLLCLKAIKKGNIYVVESSDDIELFLKKGILRSEDFLYKISKIINRTR